MAEWDFRADVTGLLARVTGGSGPRTMSQMIEAAEAVVRSGRSDPVAFGRWLDDNAETLIGQQILVASVHAQSSPQTHLVELLRDWQAGKDGCTAADALVWLREEHPPLLRAWLLGRAEGLIATVMQGG